MGKFNIRAGLFGKSKLNEVGPHSGRSDVRFEGLGFGVLLMGVRPLYLGGVKAI